MALVVAVPESAPAREAALRLLYSRLPPDQCREQTAETLSAAQRGELALDHLLMVLERDRVIGALLGIERPGGAAFLWPPVVCEGTDSQAAATALLGALGRRFDERGVRFAQCLLEPDDAAGRDALQRGGFPCVTDLLLMARPAGKPAPRGPLPALAVECYRDALRETFSRIVERTYQGTLDCPVLARIRSGEDSLEAHRAAGEFDPDGWRLYRAEGQVVGILLLAGHPERLSWEIAYLGVVPEARGRGIGRGILCDGLLLADRSGWSAEIAVDVANTPALRLYRGLGFVELRRFSVHLRLNAAGQQARKKS